MITTPSASWISRCALLISAAFVLVTVTFAQTLSSGTIEGRVLNTRNGEYLENARVTVDGTGLEAFTDSSGQYRLTNVPAGPAKEAMQINLNICDNGAGWLNGSYGGGPASKISSSLCDAG